MPSFQSSDLTEASFRDTKLSPDVTLDRAVFNGVKDFDSSIDCSNFNSLVRVPKFSQNGLCNNGKGVVTFMRSLRTVVFSIICTQSDLLESDLPDGIDATAITATVEDMIDNAAEGEKEDWQRILPALEEMKKYEVELGQIDSEFEEEKLLDEMEVPEYSGEMDANNLQSYIVGIMVKLVRYNQIEGMSLYLVYQKATKMEDALKKLILSHNETEGKKLNVECAEQLTEMVFTQIMLKLTEYDLKGSSWRNLVKIVTLRPLKMTTDAAELRYILDCIKALDDPIVAEKWLDMTEAWNQVRNLITVMKGNMVQNVLQCMFSDKKVLKSLAVANFMSGIQGGKAPEGLLVSLKNGLGAHMKSHFFVYQQQINEELAHIARIQELKQRMLAFIGSLIMAGLIGLANYASTYFYDKYNRYN